MGVKKNTHQSKDLITIGVFSALFLVVTMVSGLPFAINPILTYLLPVVTAVFLGPIYMLLIAKVPEKKSIIILGFIMGIFTFVTGMFWLWSVSYIVLGVVSAYISEIQKFKSFKLNTIGYMVFSLSTVAAYVMLWIDQKSYREYLIGKGTDPEYMNTMISSAQDWLLPAMVVGTLITAVIGALLGKKLLNKHFKKAGIV